MSTSRTWLIWLLLLSVYVAVPTALHVWQLGEPIGFAAELMALALLVLATRLSVVLAGSTLLAIFPISLLAGAAGTRLIAEAGVDGWLATTAFGVATTILGCLIVALWASVTTHWRKSAIAGSSITFGALAIAAIAPDGGTPAIPAWQALLPAGVAVLVAFLIYAWIARSAAFSALAIAEETPHHRDALGIQVDKLAQQLLLLVGLIAGLAAIPLFASPLAQQPEDWPSVWFGMLAVVLLSGRNGAADTLLVALTVLVLPRFLLEIMPQLPDLTLPSSLLALLVATLAYRGRRPGERIAASVDVVVS